MHVRPDPFPETVATARSFLAALAEAPINEFIFFDQDSSEVTSLTDKGPGAIEFREVSVFKHNTAASDLLHRLACWIQALGVKGPERTRGYLFGGVVSDVNGGYLVSIAPVDLF